MIKINNSELAIRLTDKLGIQQQINLPPQIATDWVQPITNADKDFSDMVIDYADTASGTNTVYTIPSNKYFYLTGYNMSATYDATSDCISTQLRSTINGVVRSIAGNRKITLTAQNFHVAQSFPYPIRLDKGAVIQMANSYSVGTGSKACTIFGYLGE